MTDWKRVRAAEEREKYDLERFSLEVIFKYSGDAYSDDNQKYFEDLISEIEELFDIESEGYGHGGKEIGINFLIEKPSTVRRLISKVKKHKPECRVYIIENEYGSISEEELKDL